MNRPCLPPCEAAERLAADPNTCYLDVRTVEEFTAGHPPGALNIPLLLSDPITGQMTPNPEFTMVTQRVLDPDTVLLVGCASGIRSRNAIATLGDYGYSAAIDVEGGFSGQRSPTGDLLRPGWSQSDLPIETGDGGDRSWAALRRR